MMQQDMTRSSKNSQIRIHRRQSIKESTCSVFSQMTKQIGGVSINQPALAVDLKHTNYKCLKLTPLKKDKMRNKTPVPVSKATHVIVLKEPNLIDKKINEIQTRIMRLQEE